MRREAGRAARGRRAAAAKRATARGEGPSAGYRCIYDVVRRIPRGRVATYGQVAELAGMPRAARQVGYALAALPVHTAVPWHRVINAAGRISIRRPGSDGAVRQRLLLEREGVRFTGGRVALGRYRWRGRGDR